MDMKRMWKRLGGALLLGGMIIVSWNFASSGQPTPPTADDKAATTNEDTAVSITLSGSDPETCELTFSIVSGPASGSLGAITDDLCTAGTPNADTASVTYTPSVNFNGSDTFTYKVNDGTEDSNVATVTITVTAVNDLPVADNKTASTNQATPVVITLSGSDVETCDLTFSIVSGPASGSLGVITDNLCTAGAPNTDTASVTYTPNATFTGTDSFTYTVTDADAATSAPATVTVTVNEAADLSVTKSDGVTSVTAGDGVVRTYTITVSNAGPSGATGVSLTDTWPAGFARGTVTPTQGTCDTATSPTDFTCSLGTIASGGSATVTVDYTVPSSTTGDQTNTAAVSSPVTDPATGNNAASDTNTVGISADLSITKTDSPDPVTAGNNLTYTITVDNAGPSDALGVVVSDPLPGGTTFVSASGGGVFDPVTNTVTWSLGTFTEAQAPVVLTLVARVDSSRLTALTNTASVSTSTSDPVAANNSATEPTAVVTSADMSITKTDSPDPVIAGNNLTYTITVTNLGPSNAANVEMTDTVPSETSLVSIPAGCIGGTRTVTCGPIDMVAGASVSWEIVVAVDKVGPTIQDGDVLTNHAEISATDTTDPVAANDQIDEDTTVSAPNIALTKTAVPEGGTELSPGELITFVISFQNTGSAAATGVVITDAVSDFLGEVTPSEGGVFDPDTRTITWTLNAPIGPAGSGTDTGTVSFTARLGAITKTETITNQAIATANEYAGNIESNTTSTTARRPDVLVTKDADRPENSEVRAFDVITYQITIRNRGGGRALGVVVTDDPPPYMNYVPGSTTVAGAPVADSGGTSPLFGAGVTLGTLERGDTVIVTLRMSVDVSAPAGALLENWGYATWNLGTLRSGDFSGLRVLRPRTGPTLRQTILVQGPTGRTVFVTVFNEVLELLPVSGYEAALLALLGLASLGFGRASTMRIAPDLFRRRR